MNSTVPASFLPLKTPSFNPPSLLHFATLKPYNSSPMASLQVVRASSNHTTNYTQRHPVIQNLKSIAKAAILIGATASMAGKFSPLPAKAEPTAATLSEETTILEEKEQGGEVERLQNHNQTEQSSPVSEFLESNGEAIESLKSQLQQKLDDGEEEEALKILERLVSAEPSVIDWKLLMARLLNEIGQTQKARDVFEEILAVNPLSFEALFENALLMDHCGEGEAVICRLQEALDIAQKENKTKEARDVRLIIAQIQFLQKNVDEALNSYHELSKEDPDDFRPYFCRGMIYSLLDKNEEAREQFAKYRELSPKKFEVEWYLRTPLSKMKSFGSKEEN